QSSRPLDPELLPVSAQVPAPEANRLAGPELLPAPAAPPRTQTLPGPGSLPPALPPHAPQPPPTKALPITLDTVLRLAEQHNSQIGLARERVNEAYAEEDVAHNVWWPNFYVGPAWYRHEGGIQNPDGTFVHSSSSALFGGLEIHSRLDLREA